MNGLIAFSKPQGRGHAETWAGGGDHSKRDFGIVIGVAILGHA